MKKTKSNSSKLKQVKDYIYISDHFLLSGLTLTVSTVAAVFNDINISIKWLLDLSWRMISCKLSTGDGHVIYLDPEG